MLKIWFAIMFSLLLVGYSFSKNVSIYEKMISSPQNKSWKILKESATNLSLYDITKKNIFNIVDYEITSKGHIITSAISRDMTKIAYVVNIKGKNYLQLIDLVNNKSSQILRDFIVGETNSISISSDCKKIALVGRFSDLKLSNKKSGSLEDYSLFLVDVDSKSVELIIENDIRQIFSQNWSPKDDRILYETINGDLFVYDLLKKTSSLIQSDSTNFSWSPDGKWIAYEKLNNSISGDWYLYSTVENEETKIIKKRGSLWNKVRMINDIVGTLIWSPDSNYLYYLRRVGISLNFEKQKPFLMEVKKRTEVALE